MTLTYTTVAGATSYQAHWGTLTGTYGSSQVAGEAFTNLSGISS